MTQSPVKALNRFGQSPWLDFIRRDLLHSGKLAAMRDRWGLRGITTNPTIFEQAVSRTDVYDEQIVRLADKGLSTTEICEHLMVDDVRDAADVFHGIYDETRGADGFVSLEVSPLLAHDADATIEEANRLWTMVDRPNLMIKIPGTKAGLQAIRRLLGAGININVTLLFSLQRYQDVTDAYLDGMEDAVASGRDIRTVSSVASFFVSRIDALADPILESLSQRTDTVGERARACVGEVAVACARSAYRTMESMLASERFRQLSIRGASPQRLLWASTSTKSAAYSDVKYIEPLIGPHTVNTMTMATLEAYDDHGKPAARIHEDSDRATEILEGLHDVGLDLDDLTQRLEDDGVRKFSKSFEALHGAIEARKSQLKTIEAN